VTAADTAVFNLGLAMLKALEAKNSYPELNEHIESIEFEKADYTKVGYFLYFRYTNLKNLRPLKKERFPLDGIHLTGAGLSNEAEAIVWLGKEGYLDNIEIYALGDSFPVSPENFQISIY
jgi:hypothetical protein